MKTTFMRRALVGAASLLGIWTFVFSETLSRGQPADGEIWEAPVLPQPFDSAPLRPVRVPDWVQQTLGCGYTLSVSDAAARQRAVQHGVTISELGFVDPLYAYYDSQLLKRRSPHVPLDRIQHEVAEYDRLGLRILAVYPPTLQGEVYALHPDWRRIATNTTQVPEVDLEQQPHGGMLCLLGPYGDFFIEVLAEILTRFPSVDAFSFDGLHYGGVCYCEHCRSNYRADTGAEIPDANMEDAAFRRYQHWADRRLESLIQRMQARLKGIQPEVALVTWTTNAGRFGHFLSIPRNMPARMNLLLDAPDQEFWLDETNRGATIVPAFANAYIWAVTNHRVAFSEPYLMTHGNPYGRDSFPPEEIRRRMFLALTYGAAPSIAVAQAPELQPAVYECLDDIQKRRAWLTNKQPERWSALVMSDNTRNFYGRDPGQVEQRYMANVLGTFRCTVEEHLPVTIINDWNLTPDELAGYRVVILPNTACLDQQQAAALRQYVAGGGGLVATLDTSLCNEFGDPRPDFLLADVFGVSAGERIVNEGNDAQVDANFALGLDEQYWSKRRNIFDLRWNEDSALASDKLRSYIGPSAVTFKGAALAVTPSPSAKVHARLALRAGAGQDSGTAEPMAAVVTHEYGQGRVVYLPASFDAAYYLYAYPYQRLLLKNAITWAAAESPPIQLEAPMCVHMTVMRQHDAGRKRLVIHLFNDLVTTAFHALPADDVPLREEVLPIHDLRLRIDQRYRVRSVELQPDGRSLPLDSVDSAVQVTVPRLDEHVLVVVHLE